MSMPSFDFFKSSPATEQLRIESEPPGADARTTQGQTCRTPCELTVPSGGDLTVTVAMNGYQPQTVPVRTQSPDASSSDSSARLQPNPVYVELQPAVPPRPAKKAPAKKKTSAVVKPKPAVATDPGTAPPPAPPASPSPTTGQGYPWPPAPQ